MNQNDAISALLRLEKNRNSVASVAGKLMVLAYDGKPPVPKKVKT